MTPVPDGAAPSRRSPTTPSCRTARPAPWWRRAATSSGCASRGSIRRAFSAPSSTATPGCSASRPTASTCPSARRYLPGTMVLETSWGTRGGWVIVRDALLIGPWHRQNEPLEDAPPHAHRLRRRARAAAHSCAASTARCSCNIDCEPVFDYGRSARPAGRTAGDGYHSAVVPGRGHPTLELRLTTDLQPRLRGAARHRPAR